MCFLGEMLEMKKRAKEREKRVNVYAMYQSSCLIHNNLFTLTLAIITHSFHLIFFYSAGLIKTTLIYIAWTGNSQYYAKLGTLALTYGHNMCFFGGACDIFSVSRKLIRTEINIIACILGFVYL